MMHGLPLIVIVFATTLALVALWRLVLMICIAAFLTLLTLGLVDVITWLSDLR